MVPSKGREVIFFILIPVFILLFSFIFDIVLVKVQEKRIEVLTKEIMSEVLTTNVTDYYLRVKTFYEKKEINTDLLEVKADSGYVYIYNNHSYDSFFGKLVGINHYRVETSVRGFLYNNEIIIEKIDSEEHFN